MLGMEMMLKSLGIKPEEIKETVSKIGQSVISVDTRLGAIETKLDLILGHLGIADQPENKDIEHE